MSDLPRSRVQLAVTAAASMAVGCWLLRRYLVRRGKAEDASSGASSSGVGRELPCMSHSHYEGCIYMDYNATTPVFPEVAAVMEPFTRSCFGNPSSPHVFAAPCREAIRVARQHVAALINCSDEGCIIFTSCGTESDNMAINVALRRRLSGNAPSQQGPPNVVSCATEHPAVLVYLETLAARGEISLTVLPVDDQGFVSPAAVSAALQPNTALCTIMHSNNETGTIQPLREIGRAVAKYNAATPGANVLLHSDAAQSLGKGVLIDVEAMGVHMLTVVGHKFGAPKGVAALYVQAGLHADPMLVGGGQERGRRAGTENVLLIAALGEASRLARAEAGPMLLHLLSLKRRLISKLQAGLGQGKAKLRFNGPRRSVDPAEIDSDLGLLRVILRGGGGASSPASTSLVLEQLPNTVSVSFQGVRVHQLMPLLVRRVACSAGSACHADSTQASPVLRAMHVPDDFALGTLRLSFGRHTSEREIDDAASRVISAVKSLC